MAEETRETAQQKEIASFKTEEYSQGELVAAPAAPKKEEAAPPKKEEVPTPQKQEPEKPAKSEGEVETPPAGAEGGVEKPEGTEGDQQLKPKGFQERINEITRARREAERRAEAAEAELQRLRTAPPPKEEPKKETPAADEVDPNEPKPDDFEYGELDTRYIKALANYQSDKRYKQLKADEQKEREEAQLAERQQRNREKFETLVTNGSKKREDFYEKVVIDSETKKWPLSEELGQLALESEVGDDVLYHLATHPQEATQLYRMTPVEQARQFGRLEAKFSAERAAASGEGEDTGKPVVAAQTKTTKAPLPIPNARGAGGQFQVTADTEDFSAFEARANSGS